MIASLSVVTPSKFPEMVTIIPSARFFLVVADGVASDGQIRCTLALLLSRR
jgi:hypothetical protein